MLKAFTPLCSGEGYIHAPFVVHKANSTPGIASDGAEDYVISLLPLKGIHCRDANLPHDSTGGRTPDLSLTGCLSGLQRKLVLCMIFLGSQAIHGPEVTGTLQAGVQAELDTISDSNKLLTPATVDASCDQLATSSTVRKRTLLNS